VSLEYIRQYYGVAAFKGTEIVYTGERGKRHVGVIVGAWEGYAYLLVSMPTLWDEPVPMHPTWEIEYPVAVGEDTPQ
jgi:hypothetical protein